MDTFICGGLYVTRTCFLGEGEGGRDVLDFDLLGYDSYTRGMSADNAAAVAAAAAAPAAAAPAAAAAAAYAAAAGPSSTLA